MIGINTKIAINAFFDEFILSNIYQFFCLTINLKKKKLFSLNL